MQRIYGRKIEKINDYITNDFSKIKMKFFLARMLFGEVARRPKWEKMGNWLHSNNKNEVWGLTLKKLFYFQRHTSCF